MSRRQSRPGRLKKLYPETARVEEGGEEEEEEEEEPPAEDDREEENVKAENIPAPITAGQPQLPSAAEMVRILKVTATSLEAAKATLDLAIEKLSKYS